MIKSSECDSNLVFGIVKNQFWGKLDVEGKNPQKKLEWKKNKCRGEKSESWIILEDRLLSQQNEWRTEKLLENKWKKQSYRIPWLH